MQLKEHYKTKLFTHLRAESEQEWLSKVYVAPREFSGMANERSAVIFGEEGSGKTALRLRLRQLLLADDERKKPLFVEWRLPTPVADQSDGETVRTFVAQMLDGCVHVLLQYISQSPAAYESAASWVRKSVVWFAHTYSLRDLEIRAEELSESASTEGAQILQDIHQRQPVNVVYPNAPIPEVMAQLMKTVRRLGYAGIWITVDGFETWVDVSIDEVAKMLTELLSSLALFEEPGFTFKLFVPQRLRPYIMSSGGVVRRRLDVYELSWSETQLVRIIERRLALAAGRDELELKEMGASAELTEWLTRCGGHSPRGWLEQITPFAAHFLDSELAKPLTSTELQKIIANHPPRLRIDLRTDRVFIGYGEITTDLQPTSLNMLRYLYLNKGIRSKSEIYYKAIRGLEYEPASAADKNWENPDSFKQLIDTQLWRLRSDLQESPKKPIYIFTKRGKGIALRNTG